MSKTKEEILDDQLSIMISKPEDDYMKLDVMKKTLRINFAWLQWNYMEGLSIIREF